ncbi:hypothetical protein CAPTEDRAFT_134761 [Capitella teleta]|uniref:Kringle domain-containing protein n=1 Tax=Capitella teleta TaxID=283909 RepID=R7TFE0_CAPTE|nr:hypothetical protein CAPTEDRAFT_134761 [Capitella teleta]|eukprot:ELT92493.1 hypothetical protein CAPTEDRAFT_134761 [Capitella teleta]
MCYNPAVRGFNYFGHVNTTIGGRVCQPWNSLKPHGHVQDGSMFPEGTLSAAENFCRNPDGEMSVWCYTMDPDMRWEFCDVEPCCM